MFIINRSSVSMTGTRPDPWSNNSKATVVKYGCKKTYVFKIIFLKSFFRLFNFFCTKTGVTGHESWPKNTLKLPIFTSYTLLAQICITDDALLEQCIGCANKNKQSLGKIHYLSCCNRFFTKLQLSVTRICATYTAILVTIFAMVLKLQALELKSTAF